MKHPVNLTRKQFAVVWNKPGGRRASQQIFGTSPDVPIPLEEGIDHQAETSGIQDKVFINKLVGMRLVVFSRPIVATKW